MTNIKETDNCKEIREFVITSPIGDIVITSCIKGLHSIKQNKDLTDDNFKPIQ